MIERDKERGMDRERQRQRSSSRRPLSSSLTTNPHNHDDDKVTYAPTASSAHVSKSHESPKVSYVRTEVATNLEDDTYFSALLSHGGESVSSPPSSHRRTALSPPRSSRRMKSMSPPRDVMSKSMPSKATTQASTSHAAVGYEAESQSIFFEEMPPSILATATTTTTTTMTADRWGSDYDSYSMVTSAADNHTPLAGGQRTDAPSDPPLMGADAALATSDGNDSSPEIEDTASEDDEGHDQEMMLNAEVAVVAAPPIADGLPPLPPPASPEPEAGWGMVCGVPVAQPISALADSGSGDHLDDMDSVEDYDEGEGGDTEHLEISPTGDDGEILVAAVENSTAPHLEYLRGHVVMATVEGGDVEEGGEHSSEGHQQEPRPDNESQKMIPSSSEDTPTVTLTKLMSYFGAILGVVICVVVGAVLGSEMEDDRGREPDVSERVESSPPTFSPLPLSDEYSLLIRLLEPFLQSTGSNAQRIKGTPQHLALDWLNATSWGTVDHFDLSEWMDVAVEEKGGSVLPPEEEERLIQRYTLAVLYYSTVGELNDAGKPVIGWMDDANFVTDSHECEWSSSDTPGLGVTCDDDQRVSVIDLNNNSLSGVLPPRELHGLTYLTKLDLSHNLNIKGPLPKTLGRLSNLQLLLLGHNSLTGTIPAEYGSLVKLKEFSLVGNGLSGSVPSEVSNMKSLTNIWLNQNQLTGGMNNFCQDDIKGIVLFYSDCFCRTFPRQYAEVECSCCSICCGGDPQEEKCYPNVPCTGEDCSYCSR